MFSVSVPRVPGVPSVSFSGSTGLAPVDLMIQDALDIFAGPFNGEGWGLYQYGFPVVQADTITGFDFNRAYTLSDFPIEGGTFENYNKVYTPFEGTFRFTTGGSRDARARFMRSIRVIESSMMLFDIVTPEQVYRSVNVVRVGYNRAADQGLGLLSVDVRVQEVRMRAGMRIDSVFSPGSAPQVNTGTVQTTQTAAPASAAEGIRGGR